MESLREEFLQLIGRLHNDICRRLELADGKAQFTADEWERPAGGGGKTRIIRSGAVFQNGGVNTSAVWGELPAGMMKYLNTSHSSFYACGLSLVMHPRNPFVPTSHANIRYFELYDKANNLTDQWFGGGADLTPYYLFGDDVVHFHQTMKNACDLYGSELYERFKRACDNYFYNPHRQEARGVGGIFFDRLRTGENCDARHWLRFVESVGYAFPDAYIPIVNKRKAMPYTANHIHWQEVRRGRYVEFNLLHDKGTMFGLNTNGRTESILMSLPATVRWEYDYQPVHGSEEEKLIKVLKSPRDWL
jgi:coproporphyrinogen III oxidase